MSGAVAAERPGPRSEPPGTAELLCALPYGSGLAAAERMEHGTNTAFVGVPVPPLRRPGSAWTELPRPPAPDAVPAGHVRIGYARGSTVRQSLDTQTDSLRASGVTRIFAEILNRAVTRRELDKARPRPRDPRVRGRGHDRGTRKQAARRGIGLAALAEPLRADSIGQVHGRPEA